jgi:N-acetylmuramic acid 6-phosphate etherase
MDHLQTEARNPDSANLDELTAIEFVHLMNAEDGKVVPAVASQAEVIASAIEVIADRMRAGGRLIYVGAGTSGRLGVLDASECPPTFSVPPGQVIGIIAGGPTALTKAVEGAEDQPELAERDLSAISLCAKDVLVGIASSGRTPYVLGAIAYARRLGAFTIGFSCNADSELIPLVDLAITPVVGPEVLSGSTRLKAGTATKLVLNQLTTGAMVRLGKAFGNLMVDLRASNVKLRARTNRIVRLLTGVDREEAAALLESCNGELKTALVAALARIPPAEARVRLESAGGQIRTALSSTKRPGERPGKEAVSFDAILGIDGGGTHTVALLAQVNRQEAGAWTVLGRGEAGPSNVQAIGAARAFQSLDEVVAKAFAAAGMPRRPVRAACLGLAGAGREEDRQLVRQWAERVELAADVEVTTDVRLLLSAGTPEGWGVAIVAGTGSIAFGQSPDGRSARAGGWGYLLGDEGSGYALTLAALQAVARMADERGPATRLAPVLLNRLGLQRPQELIRAVYRSGLDRTALAALAPIVLEEAEGDDAVAGGIVQNGADELSLAVAAVARELKLSRGFPLAIAGGLLLGSTSYREKLLQALANHQVQPGPVRLVHEPAEGALRLACARVTAVSS